MLYFGHQTMLFVSTLNMSVSYMVTTIGNIISSLVINQFFLDHNNISSQDLFKLNIAIVSILLLASYT
jgi:hypothetical protein